MRSSSCRGTTRSFFSIESSERSQCDDTSLPGGLLHGDGDQVCVKEWTRMNLFAISVFGSILAGLFAGLTSAQHRSGRAAAFAAMVGVAVALSSYLVAVGLPARLLAARTRTAIGHGTRPETLLGWIIVVLAAGWPFVAFVVARLVVESLFTVVPLPT